MYSLATYAIHHSSEFWEDPKSFRPERLVNEKIETVNADKMLPFSYGESNRIFFLRGSELFVAELTVVASYFPS